MPIRIRAMLVALATVIAVAPPVAIPAVDVEPGPTTKPAVPQGAALRDARARLREAYAADLFATTTASQKRALAAKLLDTAPSPDSAEERATLYAQLTLARELAISANDPATAARAVTALGQFQVDTHKVGFDTFLALSKQVSSPAEARSLLGYIRRAADDAAADERYDVARQLGSLAAGVAKSTKDGQAIAQANARARDLEELAAAAPGARSAARSLASKPDDARASRELGRFESFQAGRWDKGLPLLAAGDDPTLKGMAELELSHPDDPGKQLTLADKWWDVASAQKGLAQRRIREHAASWYARALPGLSGDDQARARHRADEYPDASPTRPAQAGATDLLKTVDVRAGTVAGTWTLDDGVLHASPGAFPARLRVAPDPGPRYRLRAKVRRPDGGDAFAIYLPVAGHAVTLVSRGKQLGLDTIAGKRFDSNDTTRVADLDDTQPHDIEIDVAAGEPAAPDAATIRVLVDGRQRIAWSGSPSDLSVNPDWAIPAPAAIGLGSWDTAYDVIELSLQVGDAPGRR